MGGPGKVFGLIAFMLRFLVLAMVLVAAWWWAMPWYAQLLGQVGGGIARFGLGVPITGIAVLPHGFLNTETLLRFYVDTGSAKPAEPTLLVAQLVTNLVPYLALVLATGGMPRRKRLRVLAMGSAIIVCGHMVFVPVFLAFQAQLQHYNEVVTATMQFFLILPFLLWIWLVYSERIATYLAEDDDNDDNEAAGGTQ